MEARRFLTRLWSAALGGADPKMLVAGYFRSRPAVPAAGRIGIFAAGKAAVRMTEGVPRRLRSESLIVAPRGTPIPASLRSRIRFASHPHPDASSVSAAKEALAFFRSFGEKDVIVALISGGTSSLLCLPRGGVTLAGKRARVREAMENGWDIARLNSLRASLSLVKGGGLAEATRARVVTLVLSDVPGSDFRIVGSGPTVSARKKRDRAVRIGDNRTGLQAAAAFARSLGVPARIASRVVSGEARAAGRQFASRLCELRKGVLLAGGETTVRLDRTPGVGGRSQELALGAAIELGRRGCAATLLCAGSDGVDGNSTNAGAFADGETTRRALRRGLDPARFLRRHDSAVFFEALGDAFQPGPTGGNVADWIFGML
jgi:hydroxypyruvate reductase